jgi:hypothetical protein
MGWQIGIKPVPAGAVEEHQLHFIHHVAVADADEVPSTARPSSAN